jgi:hypothetical protein
VSEREELRQHLVAAHHWPEVARYEATTAELEDLHEAMHDPARMEETVQRIRAILGMPSDDE